MLTPEQQRAVEIAKELCRYRRVLTQYDGIYRSFDWEAHPKMSRRAWLEAMDEMRTRIAELTQELDGLLR
jgi:hypothetical protein